MRIAVIGGGAAGFFAAVAAKRKNPQSEVIILEKTAKILTKVRLSGGGRCNVTHACFDPKLLVENYPRGYKELIGPFHRFQPRDTMDWFEERGVFLKTEKDGRVFPKSNSSQTVIDCLLNEVHQLHIPIKTQTKLNSIEKNDQKFLLNQEESFDRVILATGSSSQGWKFATQLGHTLQEPVPSLFTFNIPQFSLKELSGISVANAKIRLKETSFVQEGPLLITHFGLSGPAVLKLSAFAARYLAEKNYQTTLEIDWSETFLPKRLRKNLTELHKDTYEINGKITHKEEFVTCGGITLSEVSFKSMESKICSGLYFCGEILDIDGITGGFNFQNAWTTGWIAGNACSEII